LLGALEGGIALAFSSGIGAVSTVVAGLPAGAVVVAPSAVKVVYSENDKKWSATMDTTKEALKAAPEFKYEGRWKR